jgi:hypothetical protein
MDIDTIRASVGSTIQSLGDEIKFLVYKQSVFGERAELKSTFEAEIAKNGVPL